MHDIELAMIDFQGDEDCIRVVEHCIRCMPPRFFKRATIFAPSIARHGDYSFQRVDFLATQRETRQLYNIWRLREFPRYVRAKHVLAIQSDGFIVNPGQWTNSWLDWDYIGAPWNTSLFGGNSGFCLASKRFLKWLSVHPSPIPPEMGNDAWINHLSQEIVQWGFRVAPFDVAARFSVEGDYPERPCGISETFGFHGTIHLEEAKKITGL